MVSASELVAIVIAAISAGGLVTVALVNRRANQPKIAADVRESELRSEVGAVGALRQLREELDALRGQLRVAEEREEECRDDLDTARDDLNSVIDRLRAVESALPSALIASKLTALNDTMRATLNRITREGIVLTLPSEGGRFIYVNDTFAGWLGVSSNEVLAAGWRSLIHPADLARAQRVETAAWFGGGEGVFRYRHRDGHYVAMRWFHTAYSTDGSFCVVWLDE